MGVNIQREAGCGVAHHVLNRFNVRSAGDSNRCCGVSEVVRPGIWPADAGSNLLEVFVERRKGVVLSQFVCKDQIIGITPKSVCLLHILSLLLTLRTEIFKGNRRWLYGPGFVVLSGRRYVICAAIGLVLLKLLADGDFAMPEIDLLPRQAQTFPLPQSCEQAESVGITHANFGYEIDEYVIMRHIGTIWSLIQYYQLTGDLTVQEEIDSLISYMLEQVVNQNNKAYVLDEDDEFALGSNGLAVVVLTEYMRAFDSDKYLDVCIKLGNGILSFMNQETGEYLFIFDRDFRNRTQERLAYYEGEATFGLCLLYKLTALSQPGSIFLDYIVQERAA